jgi:hypothetical protein
MRNRVTSVTALPDAKSAPGALCLEARGRRSSDTGGSASDQSDLALTRSGPESVCLIVAWPVRRLTASGRHAIALCDQQGLIEMLTYCRARA